ncbi:non-ribosomal peptide synthase/polyketide synthase [Pandoraea norimbergensis]
MSQTPKHMVERLQSLAIERPDDIALICVQTGGETSHSYAELDQRANALAQRLGGGARKGERAILLMDSGLSYFTAFFGCLYAGVLAVPAFAPGRTRDAYAERLRVMLADAEARWVLVTPEHAQIARSLLDLYGETAELIVIDDAVAPKPSERVAIDLASDDIAFLQYTSGSTSAPKGVMVTHGNLIANEVAIQERLGVTASDVFVSWLPLPHDMGMIGTMLQPVYTGIPLVLMSPNHFLEQPIRWLEAISRHGGTISGGPDFSYRLLTERVRDAQMEGLDLSGWRVAFSGSEPVRHDTLCEFVERFSAWGFDAAAVYPCYGLAEATLLVTGVTRAGGMSAFNVDGADGEPKHLVSCGDVARDHEVRIVDPSSGQTLGDGETGEIRFHGPSVTAGYWRNPAASAATFVEDDGRRWLRTGDLGMTQDGQLYVTGRVKDMIIVRGQNVYPQDVEQAIEAELDIVRAGRVSAFPVEFNGREGIGLAAEVSRRTQKLLTPAQIVDELDAVVAPRFGEALGVVVLLNPGGLPKTSSGKLQRSAAARGWRERTLDAWAVYANGAFDDAYGASHNRGPAAEPQAGQGHADNVAAATVATRLAAIWADVLGGQIDPAEAHFFRLGGNSIQAVQLAARVQAAFHVPFDVRDVFEQSKLRDAAQTIAQRQGAAGHIDAAAAIPQISRHTESDAVAPLTHAQHRLWFLWNLDPSDTAYHVGGRLTFDASPDVPALQAALRAAIARHSALRTTFDTDATGEPVQRVADASVASQFELTHTPLENDNAINEAAQAWIDAPFDLRGGPMMRATLFETPDHRAHLVVALHHIVCDAWSMQGFVDALADDYRTCLSGGSPSALPESDLKYTDFAVWQRALRDHESRKRELAYWCARLGDDPAPAILGDRTRIGNAPRRAATHPFDLPPSVLTGLAAAVASNGVTPSMLILAALGLVLRRHTASDDVRVGMPVANRQHGGTASLMGLFVNTVVMKLDVQASGTLSALIAQVRETALEAQQHQDLPFDVLLDTLAPHRSLGQTPLFQVMYNHVQQDERSLARWPALSTTLHGLDASAAQFDLTLDVQAYADGRLTPKFRYDADTFDASTVARLAAHLCNALQALVQHADTTVSAVALIERDERDRLVQWSANAQVSPGLPLHRRIEAHAARTPEAVALTFEDTAMTYGELNARANQLAHALIARGVGLEARVGIALERSPEMVVAILAVLKAGGAYVPLDPQYPSERLSFLMSDSGMTLLLTRDALRGELPVPEGVATLLLEDFATETNRTREGVVSNPDVPVSPSNLAYIIYTSGSTGKPKGALVTHANVGRLLDATQADFAFGPQDVWTLFHSYAFDFSVWEIFGALCYGGRLVVVPYLVSRAADDFLTLLRRERVTVLNQTPSAFRQLLQVPALAEADDLALRFVVFGGEALEPQTLRPWFDRFGDTAPRMINMYGITETTVHVTFRQINRNDLSVTRSPVGRAIGDLGLYVLDAQGELAPIGVPGELHVSGAGLARGYWHRAALTAQRFIPDGFSGDGGRLYRTGDLARWRADGELDYLGRIDHQVKIRGFRIELGEIEAQLLAQPGVHGAVASVQEGPGGARLIAHVAGDAHVPVLRAALGAVLPDYMVPKAIVVMPVFPLTANGKVDRRALPAPEFGRGIDAAPRAGTEATLAHVWQTVLGVPSVGRHDNFFAIGGDSLLTLKVVNRATLAGLTLSPRHLFEHQSLADLAEALDSAAAATNETAPPALVPVERAAGLSLPLSYAQQRLWFLWHLQPESSAYHIAGGLRLQGAFDDNAKQAVQAAFDTLVARHESLRVTFAPGDSDGDEGELAVPVAARQIVHDTMSITVRHYDVSHADDPEADAAALADAFARETFDLSRGPLLRVGIVTLGEQAHQLLVSMHHIISDGWSVDRMLDEFVACYRAHRDHVTATLPVLPVQYADYAVWQRRWLDAGERDRQLAWWRGVLGDQHPVLALPADRERAELADYTAARHSFVLPAQLTRRLRACAQRHDSTLFVALLTAYMAMLHRHAGAHDIRVGVPVANRERPEISDVLGCFVNTQVMQARVGHTQPLGTLLQAVRAHVAGAQAHQDLPFDVLVNALQPERNLRHTPIFQVVLNHRQPDHRVFDALDGLTVSRMDIAGRNAQFELTLDTEEADDGSVCAAMTYAREIFDEATVALWADHFVTFCEALAADTSISVGDVALHYADGSVMPVATDALVGDRGESGREVAVAIRSTQTQSGRNAFEAPVSPAEQAVAAAWQAVLQIDRVDRHDNFFEIGGDSILSLQIVSALARQGWKITARQLFEAQTVATLAALAQPLAEGSRSVVKAKSQVRAPVGQADDNVEATYPATPLQSGLLFHSLMQSGRGVYVNQKRLTLRGSLDHERMRDAWTRVMARHAILRTHFSWAHGGDAMQVVSRHVALPYTRHDWSAGPQATYDARLHAWLADDLAQGFDLAVAPLLRVNLFARPDGLTDLVWTDHHVLLDGWSAAQLLAEVLAIYRRETLPEAASTPQYGDYVHWLTTQPDHADYWQARMQALDEPATLVASLPSAQGGHDATSGPLLQVDDVLDSAMDQRLREAARQHRVTLNTMIQAAWALLTSRYGHRSQAAFGVTVSGRENDLPGIDRTLGLFINSLPMWVDVPAAATISAWLQDVQQRGTALRAVETTPLRQVQQWSGRAAEALFDTLVVFENYPIDATVRADDASLSLAAFATTEQTHYPLVLAVLPGDTLTLRWKAKASRIDARTLAQLQADLRAILDQLSSTLDAGSTHVGTITLAGQTVPSSLTRHEFTPVMHRIAAQAKATPQRPAIHCEGVRWSYRELDAAANRIAVALVAAGVRADERVGLCVERSPWMTAALLGVLRAGGAFVPLDPSYPSDRLVFMMEDAGVRRVLTDAATAQAMASVLDGHEVIVVDTLDPADSAVVCHDVHPDQLAYVIYTSGSTGRPKGVAIPHGAFSQHIDDFLNTYAITQDDKQLQSSTINFDVALHEMLPALCKGGQIEMRGPQAWDLATTSRHLSEEGVTFSRIPTAYWQQWLRNPPPREALAALRQITVGGEGLPGDALRQWQDGPLSGIQLDNLYGPTETTVACMYRRTCEDDTQHAIVSIGVPYPSRRVYVIDAHGNEAPVDALGELCIAGHTLARGYLGRASLSAEKFVPDPFAGNGARMYRTGDLCRRRADGRIDFLGRLDAQVKLRGLRIELGEIDAVLRQVPGVRDAVVALVGAGEGARLAGYVVGDVADVVLRRSLERKLPGHMVPSVFVHLDALPVMPNGKTDRAALPLPQDMASRERQAPVGPVQTALRDIWRDVLGRDDVGVTDNFFEIGGDSILSLRVIAQAALAGLKLTPRHLFDAPDIERLALLAEPLHARPAHVESREPLPLTPIQATFFDRHPHGEAHWNQAVLLQSESLPDAAALRRALDALVQAHDALRLRFVRTPSGWQQQVVAVDAHNLLETLDLRGEPDWRAAIEREGSRVHRSLDIGQGPLLRALLMHAPDGAYLLITIHHLAVDGVSWRVLLDELERGYHAAHEGRAIELSDNTPWSVWVQASTAHAASADVIDELPWWRNALSGASPLFGATSKGRPRQTRHALLGAQATRQLVAQTRSSFGLQVDEALLGVLARALGDTFGCPDAIVAVEGHGRESLGRESSADLDLSGTIGWFTTRYPVRLPVSGALADQLIATKDGLRDVPNKGLHWGLLAWHARDDVRRAAAALPVAQVGFNYLGNLDRAVATGSTFALSTLPCGEMAAPAPAPFALDLNARIQDGALSITWDFDPDIVGATQVERCIERFDARLQAFIEATRDRARIFSRSDFPRAALNAEQWRRLALDATGVEDVYPATAVQQGLLYHDLSLPGEGMYITQKRVTLIGDLNIAALRQAWERAVARHAALRTRFAWHHGGPILQIVQSQATLPFTVHPVPAGSTDIGAYERGFTQWLASDLRAGFDVERAPLLRVNVFMRPDNAADLVWTAHHAITDGWSSALLMAEVVGTYRAVRGGDERQASAAPAVPYSRYVDWIARQPSSRDWWVEQAGEVADRGQLLAYASSVSPEASTDALTFEDVLPDALGIKLVEAAQRHQVTINTVMQGAWALLIAQHSFRQDVTFGVTVSGRPASLPGAQEMLGLCINSLPLFVTVKPSQDVGVWLRSVQAQNVSLREHEHTPLASVQQWLGLNGTAPFDSLIVFENYPVAAGLLDGDATLRVGQVQGWERTHYPVTLTVATRGTPTLGWRFDTSRCSGEDAAQWRRQYLCLLEAMANTPVVGSRVADCLTPTVDTLGELGVVQATAFDNATVPARIARQASLTPDAEALVLDDRTLTFAGLDAAANGLARRLAGMGITPEARVGVAMTRSIDMVVALLAVMKAGGAYVPLDPAYPPARIAHMIEDSGVSVVLSQAAVSLALADGVRRLDIDDAVLAVRHTLPPEVALHGDNLAYVIHTSGSTGVPKGVAVSHGALTCHVDATIAYAKLSAADRVLQFSTVNFDGFVEQLFPSLCVGATVVLRGPDVWSSDEFVARVRRHGITVAHLPTAYWHALTQDLADSTESLAPLREFHAGGEAMSAQALRRTRESAALAPVTLINTYGPTEATITATVFDADEIGADALPSLSAFVPIGRALPGRRLYVVSPDLSRVPHGAPGELLIGGELLARGYLNRPGLSAERFVPDAFGGEGGRLYRTGDLVRWRDDGALDYLGRIDHQIKLRGYRIEPGEIEAALTAQAGVREAAVVVRTEGTRARLIAYIGRDTAQPVDGAQLRDALATRLPEYMVPETVVVLDALPLTPGGKVDRVALPDPGSASATFEAPQGEAERVLADLWQTVLSVPQVGRHDNFFALGGDSILSLQVVARARQAGLTVSPKQLFTAPTLAALAAVATQAGTTGAVRAPTDDAPGHVPLLPIQHAFFATGMRAVHHWHQALLLTPAEPLDVEALRQALVSVVAHHAALRMRFVPDTAAAGGWRQSYTPFNRESAEGMLWTRVAANTHDVEAIGNEAHVSIHLTDGPVLRAVLIAMPDASQRLLLTAHHLVVDGVSWRILLGDLRTAYDAWRAGRAPALAATGTSYRTWAESLVDGASRSEQRDELAYWSSLRGATHLPVVDTDAPSLAGDLTRVERRFNRDITQQLLQDAGVAYRTQTGELLLVAVARALQAWTDAPDYVIALEGHGREPWSDDVDLSRTVGWHTSLYPFAVQAQGDLRDAILRTKSALRAVPQRGLGFGVMRWLGDDATREALAAVPVPAVVFNYLGRFDSALGQDWQPAGEALGQTVASDTPLTHDLSIDAKVVGGELNVALSFSARRLKPQGVEALAAAIDTELSAILAHCLDETAAGVTSGDFPLAALDDAMLATLPLAWRDVDDLYPLAPMQAGLLFHAMVDGQGGAYLNQMRVDIDGLDPARFEAAWQTVCARHPMLRTGFVTTGSKLLQWVARQAPVPFLHLDWREQNTAPSDATDTLDALALAQREQPFDLAVPPLQRVALVRTGVAKYHLIWTCHHLLLDGWSTSRLIGEVMRHYHGEPGSAPTATFRDYVQWLAGQGASTSGSAAVFWRDTLGVLDEPTRLAPRELPPAAARDDFATEVTELDAATVSQLNRFAARERVTVNTLAQGAWALMLHQATGHQHVAFGTTVAGRPASLPGADTIVGLFINTVPVVSQRPERDAAGDWLRDLQSRRAQAGDFEHTPLHDIQRAALVTGALFDTLFVFENFPVDGALAEAAAHGLTLTGASTDESTHYPLAVTVVPGDQWRIRWSYRTQAFSRADVSALSSRFAQTLRALSGDGLLAAADALRMTSDAAQHVAALGAPQPLPIHDARCLHERIAAHALQSPNATALRDGDTIVTYGELDAQANRLAHRLLARGIGPEARIGIGMTRSPQMIVAMLATLKAGAAYVPVDPAYPAERLSYLMADSGMRCLLTRSVDRDLLPVPEGLAVIDVADEALPDDVASSNAPMVAVHPRQLAYVIYTSGSTGKPKGTQLTHANVMRLLDQTQARFGFGERDVWTLFHSFAFDFSVWEIFGALCYGGTLVIVPHAVSRAPAEFAALLRDEGVTVLNQTPSAFRQLLQIPSMYEPGLRLRTIIFGGEALEVRALAPWFAHYGDHGPALVNMYGITETTVHVTARELTPQDVDAERSPVGRPIGDLGLYVLDAWGELAPLNIPGELHVSGAGLAPILFR